MRRRTSWIGCPGSTSQASSPSQPSSAPSSSSRLLRRGGKVLTFWKRVNCHFYPRLIQAFNWWLLVPFTPLSTYLERNKKAFFYAFPYLHWNIWSYSVQYFTFRMSNHGILAGNHSSRVESSANGKFHNYLFWICSCVSRTLLFDNSIRRSLESTRKSVCNFVGDFDLQG